MNPEQTHLSKNFMLSEFAVSADHPELAAKITLNEADEIKLFQLCATILQPVRDVFSSTKIISGKRNGELNVAVEGSKNSDHIYWSVHCAVDFTLPQGGNVSACYNWIKETMPYAFGQLILYRNRGFIHVSLPTYKHHYECWVKG